MLALQRRRLLGLDVRLHFIQTNSDLAPRNAIRIGLDVKSFHQPASPLSQTQAKSIHKGGHSELDISDARRTTRFKLQNDSIHAPHTSLDAILHHLVETIPHQVHQPPPKICKGIATTASTNAIPMITST